MGFNIADGILADELDSFFQAHSGETWHVHLYQNNYDPVPGEVIGDYTEATFSSYAAQPFNPGNMSAASVAAHVATSTLSAAVTFTHGSSGAAQTVYGYYVTDGSGALAWGEKFAAARTLNPTDQELVTPRYRNKNCP